MFTSSEEVLRFIKDEAIEFVDVRFTDLPGQQQHFNVPAAGLTADFFSEGVMFDGSSIRGFAAIHKSDMKLIPDPATAFVDPFRVAKTLNMNFSIVEPRTGEPYERDPRQVATKAEAYLKSTGIADTVYFGPEAEFYVFDDVRFQTSQNEGFYHIDSIEGAWNTGRVEEGGNRGYKPRYKGGYFPVPPMDHYADLRDQMTIALIAAGIGIERAHHEVGTAGQAEINYRYNSLTHAADEALKFKYIVKNVAWANGKTATFMPKPLFGDNGSGMHCHQSLWKEGAPLFYDELGYAGLSDIARHYIGGLLHHAPSLLAFTNPDRELVSPTCPRLRSSREPRIQLREPVSMRPDPHHRDQCQGQANRIPDPGLGLQPVPRVLRDDARRRRRHPEQDRAAHAGRQGSVRIAAGRGRRYRPGAGVARRGAPRSRSRQRVPAGRWRLHRRRDRRLDHVQADQRDRPDPAPPAPARIRALLRRLTCSDAGGPGFRGLQSFPAANFKIDSAGIPQEIAASSRVGSATYLHERAARRLATAGRLPVVRSTTQSASSAS